MKITRWVRRASYCVPLVLLASFVDAPAWAVGDYYLGAQLVVGNPLNLSAGDVAVRDLLQAMDVTVTLIDDDSAAYADEEIALVVIAPSTSGATLGTKYESIETPLLVFASSAWDSMGLTEDDGTVADSTSLNFVNTSLGISTSLTSPVQVVANAQPMRSMSAANLADGATPVAVRTNNTNANVVFVIDSGAALASGAGAPARRGVVGFTESALTALSTDGATLVRNMVTWTSESTQAFSSVTSADNPCSASSLIVCYRMDDSTNTLHDSQSPSSDASWSAGNGVKRVQRATQFAEYQFTGWNIGGGSALVKTRDPVTNRLTNVRLDNNSNVLAPGFGQIIVDDAVTPSANPTSEDFNPGTGNFRITTRIRPLLFKFGGKFQLPDPATAGDSLHASYNVVQKGRNGTVGGNYKIEIMGYTTGNFVKGAVHCVMQDGQGHMAEVYSIRPLDETTQPSSNFYTIDCYRKANTTPSSNDGQLTLTLTKTDGGSLAQGTTVAPASTLGDVSPTNAGGSGASQYGPDLSLGKKPGSSNTGDSFSGNMDYLTLTRG